MIRTLPTYLHSPSTSAVEPTYLSLHHTPSLSPNDFCSALPTHSFISPPLFLLSRPAFAEEQGDVCGVWKKDGLAYFCLCDAMMLLSLSFFLLAFEDG
jgi:hypothetical protein